MAGTAKNYRPPFRQKDYFAGLEKEIKNMRGFSTPSLIFFAALWIIIGALAFSNHIEAYLVGSFIGAGGVVWLSGGKV